MSNAVLEGSLASFKLPEVLTFLQATRKSGTLALSCEGREARVFIEAGAVVYAGSNQESFRLGTILLRRRRIDRSQYDRIEQLMHSDGGRFGQIAVQEGVLTDAQLRDFLKVQVSEILYDAFVWTGGHFTFSPQLDLPPYAVTISVDLTNLIMEGARRIEEWEHCLRLLPDKGMVFRVVSHPPEDKISLTGDEWKLLFLINGRRTLEDLCQEAGEEPFAVYRVVYGLLGSKLIEPVPAAERNPAAGETAKTRAVVPQGEETMRQEPATFSGDSTVREADDDTSLLVSSQARLSYRDVVRPTVAQLTLLSGEESGTVIPLSDAEYLIGRQRDNAIRLNDLGVSGHHARIFRGPEGYVVEDLKSRNGTWVNDARVFQAVLKDGDRLRIGTTQIEYQVLYEAPATPG